MTMIKHDLRRAREARDVGMQQALFGTPEQWRADYCDAVNRWFTLLHVGSTFIGEGLRIAATNSGVSAPDHPNAWGANSGAFIRRWLREQRIVLDGVSSASGVASHAHVYRQYRKLK